MLHFPHTVKLTPLLAPAHAQGCLMSCVNLKATELLSNLKGEKRRSRIRLQESQIFSFVTVKSLRSAAPVEKIRRAFLTVHDLEIHSFSRRERS